MLPRQLDSTVTLSTAKFTQVCLEQSGIEHSVRSLALLAHWFLQAERLSTFFLFVCFFSCGYWRSYPSGALLNPRIVTELDIKEWDHLEAKNLRELSACKGWRNCVV